MIVNNAATATTVLFISSWHLSLISYLKSHRHVRIGRDSPSTGGICDPRTDTLLSFRDPKTHNPKSDGLANGRTVEALVS